MEVHTRTYFHPPTLCLLVGAFNPFTFKVIIDMYDPMTIFLIVLGENGFFKKLKVMRTTDLEPSSLPEPNLVLKTDLLESKRKCCCVHIPC